MNTNYMITAQDVVDMLGISKGHAYKIIRQLNKELKITAISWCPVRFPKRIGIRNFMVIRMKRQQRKLAAAVKEREKAVKKQQFICIDCRFKSA